MTQEEKELILKDLCGRTLYGVLVEYDYGDGVKRVTKFHGNYLYLMMLGKLQWKDFKPYLRQMSSMTEEESKEFALLQTDFYVDGFLYPIAAINMVNWLNKHHFDYLGLIPMGLAIEVPEGVYNTKTE